MPNSSAVKKLGRAREDRLRTFGSLDLNAAWEETKPEDAGLAGSACKVYEWRLGDKLIVTPDEQQYYAFGTGGFFNIKTGDKVPEGPFERYLSGVVAQIRPEAESLKAGFIMPEYPGIR